MVSWTRNYGHCRAGFSLSYLRIGFVLHSMEYRHGRLAFGLGFSTLMDAWVGGGCIYPGHGKDASVQHKHEFIRDENN